MPYSKRNYKTRQFYINYPKQTTLKLGISCDQFYDFSAETGWRFKNSTKQGTFGGILKHKFANFTKMIQKHYKKGVALNRAYFQEMIRKSAPDCRQEPILGVASRFCKRCLKWSL